MKYDDWEIKFNQLGYAVLPKIFSAAEVESMSNEATRLWHEQEYLNPRNLRVGLRSKGGEVVLERLDPVSDISALYNNVALGDSLTSIAESILDKPVVCLKDKLIYKWPGCPGYGLHRDEPYFGISGVPGNDMVSVYVAIDSANEVNGGIQFYGELRNAQLIAPAAESRDISPLAVRNVKPVCPSLDSGDVLIFDGMVPHFSKTNMSTLPRRMFTATYVPQEYKGCRDRYYAGRFAEQEVERAKLVSGSFMFK